MNSVDLARGASKLPSTWPQTLNQCDEAMVQSWNRLEVIYFDFPGSTLLDLECLGLHLDLDITISSKAFDIFACSIAYEPPFTRL